MAGMDQKVTAFSVLSAALRGGDLVRARNAVADLVEAEPHAYRYWAILADIEAQLGDSAGALAALDRASELRPEDPQLAAMSVELRFACGDRAGAIAAASSLDVTVLDAARADRLGALLAHSGHPAAAVRFFERAVCTSSESPQFRFNLATAQHMVGQSAAAEDNLNRVLAVHPLDGQAQLVRSRLRRQTSQSNHVAQLQASLKRVPEGPDRVAIRFALAKELEDLGRHAESFAELGRANAAVRAAMDYDVAADVAVLEALGHEGRPRVWNGSGKGDGVIFVMGLPRSGTTLVERILASHPDVKAAGETGLFAALTVEAVRTLAGGSPPDRQAFAKWTEDLDHAELGARFLSTIEGLIGRAGRFTEKTPDNYLYAGLISRALPAARLVLLERNPMDSCYALYKSLFNRAFPFSYDLRDLASYYIAWRGLMGRWKALLGSSMIAVNYERLVRNQEEESRRMLAHCGLAWDDRVLNFQNLQAPVATASTAQVREAIHDRSVGLWRRYEPQLEPLRERLAAAGIDLYGP